MFKKMLITMLVLMAASSAMAGDMDWKFYGKLHTSIDFLNDGTDSQTFLASNTSRFGFKGGTELNENFYFIWQFENAINITQKGGGSLASRNTYVGVKGNWGKFLGGIHDTPFKMIGRKVEFFKDELGDFRQSTMGWDRRLQEVVAYATPEMGGFWAMLAYQFDQGGNDKFGADQDAYEAMTAFSGAAAYSKNAFFLAVAYESLSKGYADQDYIDFIDDTMEAESQSAVRAAAKWDNETIAISALYQTISNFNGAKDWSSNTFGVEAMFRFAEAKWAAKGSYFMTNPWTDASDLDANVNGNFLALGIDHNVSKAVKFYVQYAMVMNDDDSYFGLGGSEDPVSTFGKVYGNGHGAWAPASYDDDGMVQDPNGFSVGTAIKF